MSRREMWSGYNPLTFADVYDAHLHQRGRNAMTRQEIQALFARRQEALERHDVVALAHQHADICVMDSPTAGGPVKGRAAIADVYQAWFTAFPDLIVRTEEPVIDGDRVAQLATQSGTDTGGFLGLPPTGKPFRIPIVWLFTLEGQQFVHVRPIYDFTGLLLQIGLLKAKPA